MSLNAQLGRLFAHLSYITTGIKLIAKPPQFKKGAYQIEIAKLIYAHYEAQQFRYCEAGTTPQRIAQEVMIHFAGNGQVSANIDAFGNIQVTPTVKFLEEWKAKILKKQCYTHHQLSTQKATQNAESIKPIKMMVFLRGNRYTLNENRLLFQALTCHQIEEKINRQNCQVNIVCSLKLWTIIKNYCKVGIWSDIETIQNLKHTPTVVVCNSHQTCMVQTILGVDSAKLCYFHRIGSVFPEATMNAQYQPQLKALYLRHKDHYPVNLVDLAKKKDWNSPSHNTKDDYELLLRFGDRIGSCNIHEAFCLVNGNKMQLVDILRTTLEDVCWKM